MNLLTEITQALEISHAPTHHPSRTQATIFLTSLSTHPEVESIAAALLSPSHAAQVRHFGLSLLQTYINTQEATRLIHLHQTITPFLFPQQTPLFVHHKVVSVYTSLALKTWLHASPSGFLESLYARVSLIQDRTGKRGCKCCVRYTGQ